MSVRGRRGYTCWNTITAQEIHVLGGGRELPMFGPCILLSETLPNQLSILPFPLVFKYLHRFHVLKTLDGSRKCEDYSVKCCVVLLF